MNAIAYTGNTAVREVGAPRHVSNAQGDQAVRIWHGIYSDLLAIKPAYGATFLDMPAGFRVDDVELTGDGPNLKGELVVHFTNFVEGFGTDLNPIWELTWEDLFKDIITHPNFDPQGTAGTKLTGAQVASLPAWKNENYTNKIAFKYRPDPNKSATNTLTGNARTVAEIYLDGAEGFNIAVPVITATTYHFSLANLTDVGAWFREDPTTKGCPAALKPAGWQWMRTADTITNTRRNNTRQRRWMAAKIWHPALYEEP
jgi:hypothetical protein